MINYGYTRASIELLGLINTRDDYYSALCLDNILHNMRNVERLSSLLSELAFNNSTVLMPGRGIERVDKYLLDSYDIIIVCDSATDYLSNSDVLHDLEDRTILVTDLDSRVDSLIGFCKATRPIVIVHAHGDNVERLYIIRELDYLKICGTCQVYGEFNYVEYCDGFSDGDRALLIASRISRRVSVHGLDLESTLSHKGIDISKRIKLGILMEYVYQLRSDIPLLVY